ncbi:MAG: hypothetical protein OXH59_02985 [Rhodospirillaceae bacterium]|nr:hypothetical protein [Rhodospirillaceae bacterium]
MPISNERLAEIAAISDDRIDTSDIPEMGEAFFAAAKLVVPPTFPFSRHFDRSAEGA